MDLICREINWEIIRTFWYSSLTDSPFSQEERPRRKTPKIMSTINPRTVKVTITSIKVNPNPPHPSFPKLIFTLNLGRWTQGVSFCLDKPLIKFEIRNPKSETIPKSKFSNDRNGYLTTPPFGILVIRHSNLFRYSCFDSRIFVFINPLTSHTRGVQQKDMGSFAFLTLLGDLSKLGEVGI